MMTHAYLYTGPEQVGKKRAALEMAQGADVLLVTENGIDAVREAKQFLSLRSFTGGKRIVIIDDAHRLTEEAQNALLKVLEEPSPSGMLLLVTAHPDALLETIRSRCQERVFAVASRKEFALALKDNQLKTDQIEFLYDFTGGAIGLAIDLLANTGTLKSAASELNSFLKMNVSQRFTKTKELADRADIRTNVLYWMRHAHASKKRSILRPLLDLYTTLQQPQFGRQLALERFMIELK